MMEDHTIIPFEYFEDLLDRSEELNTAEDKAKEKELMEKMSDETKQVAQMMYHILNN